MQVISKKAKVIRLLLILFFLFLICWFILCMYEYKKVSNGSKPIICLHTIKDVESPEEYSKTCYGIFTKYREYYLEEDDRLNAREYTLIWKEFKREVD